MTRAASPPWPIPAVVERDSGLNRWRRRDSTRSKCSTPSTTRGTTARYGALARRLKLGATGGSDFHGDDAHGATAPGFVSLPREEFEQLKEQLEVRLKPDPTY
jgi:hypothetical protein